MCISKIQDIRVSSLGGSPGDNALKDYGLDFATLNLLNEYDLVISDYNSWHEFVPCNAVPRAEQQTICIPLSYQGRHWILVPMSDNGIGKPFRINGVALTQSGRELFKIVKVEPMDKYSQELSKFFVKEGFRLIEVGDGEPRVVSVNAVTGFDTQ